jgi:hypothetical protein
MNTMSNQEPDQRNKPDCWKCVYFKISWDPSKPYACQMMGFKSRMIPSLEVRLADGHDCRGFTPKQGKPHAVDSVGSVSSVSSKKLMSPMPRMTTTSVWEA